MKRGKIQNEENPLIAVYKSDAVEKKFPQQGISQPSSGLGNWPEREKKKTGGGKLTLKGSKVNSPGETSVASATPGD